MSLYNYIYVYIYFLHIIYITELTNTISFIISIVGVSYFGNTYITIFVDDTILV